MRLLSISVARSIWFFHLGDLNPRGKAVDKNLLLEIGKKYSFAIVPDVKQIVEARQKNTPLDFTNGVFKSPTGEVIDIKLSLYRDALFADTRSSTTDSDAFLTDMLETLASEFGLVDYKTLPIRKLYVSELFVALDKPLNLVNPKFSQFAASLQKKIKTPFKNISFELGSIGFWIDPDVKHHHVQFRLERQAEVGFAEGRFYAMAPLETEEHLKALTELESLFVV